MSKLPLSVIAFLQALGQAAYIGLVSIIFWKGNEWFGPIKSILGPILVLTLFVVSAIISALIVGGYPFILFWEKKRTREALKLVAYTSLWLALFFFIVLGIILLS